jgi:hypothetical protein
MDTKALSLIYIIRILQVHILYTIVVLHPGVFQVLLFIFLPQGRTDKGNILITHTYDGETNHLLQAGVNQEIGYMCMMINDKGTMNTQSTP